MTETHHSVALVHDYLTQRGGAERVVLRMLEAFPDAPVYTSFFEPSLTFPEFPAERVRTLPLDRLRPLRRRHRLALPLLAAAFSLVCVVLLVGALRARDGHAVVAGARLEWSKIVATMAALFVYAFVLERVGFVAATFALLLFFFKVLERQRWRTALAGSLVTAFVTYLVFKVWLNVQLPAGPWSG
jgi:hypothetical protein